MLLALLASACSVDSHLVEPSGRLSPAVDYDLVSTNAHPSADIFFVGSDYGNGGNHVLAIDGSDESVIWDTITDTSSLTNRRNVGIVYVDATDKLWVWSEARLFIIDPTDGSVEDTILPSAYSATKFKTSSSPSIADESVYVPVERIGSPNNLLLKIDPSDASLEASYATPTSGLAVRYTTANHAYFVRSSQMRAHAKSDMSLVGGSDHGNFGGSGFTVGTGTSAMSGKFVFNSTDGNLYTASVDTAGGWYVIDPDISTHNHGDATQHQYLPSNTEPGANIDHGGNVIYGMVYADHNGKIYLLTRETGTSNKELHEITPNGALAPTIDATTLVESNGVEGWLLYLPSSDRVVVVFANGNYYTY